MPALFAYLIAIGLLLGGGYGALDWLAAPEPVKVLRKAKPKATQPSSSEARLNAFPEADQPANAHEEGSTQVGSSSTDEKDIASSSNDRPARSNSSVAAADRIAPPDLDTMPSSDDSKRIPEGDLGQSSRATLAVSSNSSRTAAFTTAPASKTFKGPPHSRQTSNPSKRPLSLMTLRTIEFPDGRRVTQLLPYRGAGERTLAFGPDD